MSKFWKYASTTALSALLVAGGAVSASADISVDKPGEPGGGSGGGIYEGRVTAPRPPGSGREPEAGFDPWDGIPGQNKEEIDRGGWSGGKGGEKSGTDKKKTKGAEASPPVVVNNANAGKNVKPKIATVVTFKKSLFGPDTFETVEVASVRDVAKETSITPDILPGGRDDDKALLVGFSVKTAGTPLAGISLKDLSSTLFRVSGGQLASCQQDGPEIFHCTLQKPRAVPAAQMHRWNILPEGTLGAGVPICNGVIVDGAVGVETRIDLEDVDCEAESGLEPTKFEVERVFVDPSYGFPTIASDGSIRVTPTSEAQGHYIPMQVWASNDDGVTSWPFYVVVRTRYAPQSAAPATLEAIRGVETTVPASSLFSDVDVNEHQAESGDALTYEVTNTGSYGGAWFDASGTLHYRSIDVLGPGEHTDLITLRATDKWGATTEASIRIPIVEVRPGCANGDSITDATTTVHVVPNCWLDAPTSYRGANLTYSITGAPEHGAISGFDPVTGSFTYTPDLSQPGVYTVHITADNKGATRETLQTIEVLPAP